MPGICAVLASFCQHLRVSRESEREFCLGSSRSQPAIRCEPWAVTSLLNVGVSRIPRCNAHQWSQQVCDCWHYENSRPHVLQMKALGAGLSKLQGKCNLNGGECSTDGHLVDYHLELQNSSSGFRMVALHLGLLSCSSYSVCNSSTSSVGPFSTPKVKSWCVSKSKAKCAATVFWVLLGNDHPQSLRSLLPLLTQVRMAPRVKGKTHFRHSTFYVATPLSAQNMHCFPLPCLSFVTFSSKMQAKHVLSTNWPGSRRHWDPDCSRWGTKWVA